MTKLKTIFIFIITQVLNYVLSISKESRFYKPFNNLKKKVSSTNLFGTNLFGFVSSSNILNLIRDRISLGGNNDNTQNRNNIQNEASSLSMFASNGINNNNQNNLNNKSGTSSPTSITFSIDELEDIDKLNNKLSFYNHSPAQIRSPAHEFEMLSSGIDDGTTKSCKVVGFLDYDPLQAAYISHSNHKKNTHNKKNFFNMR